VLGPANATLASPYRPRSRDGSIGIAPHASPSISKQIIDHGPMWTSGLSVIRPWRTGVSSPSRTAAMPWASSCSVMLMTTTTAQARK